MRDMAIRSQREKREAEEVEVGVVVVCKRESKMCVPADDKDNVIIGG